MVPNKLKGHRSATPRATAHRKKPIREVRRYRQTCEFRQQMVLTFPILLISRREETLKRDAEVQRQERLHVFMRLPASGVADGPGFELDERIGVGPEIQRTREQVVLWHLVVGVGINRNDRVRMLGISLAASVCVSSPDFCPSR